MHTIDIIILTVVAALLLLALRATLKHYSGKGGGCCCCSGCSSCSSGGTCASSSSGDTSVFKSTVSDNTPSKVIQISGMHCSTCTRSVESALTSVKGVICADADLSNGTAKVFFRGEVPDDILKEAVEEKGFEVKEIG